MDVAENLSPAPPATRRSDGGSCLPGTGLPENGRIADRLDEIGALLQAQAASPFRVAAYQAAASVVRSLDRPVADILAAEGVDGLVRLPKIGVSLARTIEQLAHAGTTPLLQRLRGAADPERTLRTVPGIGRHLSTWIHERLGIETLADLEAAAWDGRLKTVPGMGARRVDSIRGSLAARLGRPRPSQPAPRPADEPSVDELLSVDEEYCRKSARQQLTCVAPYRFNPTRAAWLPILHTARGDRHYTALYSNTARAHTLGTTHDWVVIYRDDPAGHGQWAVVTARLGPLRGKRIVRGREAECARHYSPDRAAIETGRRLI